MAAAFTSLELRGQQARNDVGRAVPGGDPGSTRGEHGLDARVAQPRLEAGRNQLRLVGDEAPGHDLVAAVGQQPLDKGAALVAVRVAGVGHGQHRAADRLLPPAAGGLAFVLGG